MPRDINGNYTLPAGNPVVTGTIIDVDWANPTLADIANELTNSLSRDGEGGMLSPLRFLDGTVVEPSISWINEPQTGFYRYDTNDFRVTVGAQDVFRFTKGQVYIWDPVNLSWFDVKAGIDSAATALGTSYDNTDSSLLAENVKAGLDELSLLVDGIIAGINMQGSWDALNNVPDLTAIVPNDGDYWVVSVAGNTDLGGIAEWDVGDLALYQMGVWVRITAFASPPDSKFEGSSSVDFNALAEKRIRDNAGSGDNEWGQHLVGQAVNQGLYGTDTVANTLYLGGGNTGVSRTIFPIKEINGIRHNISYVNSASIANNISFAPAPDGTKTYDSATGAVVQHPDSATAFAAETATNKVITSRQDYVFIESWHEAIEDKGVVYPLGNVQYGAFDYEGIPLAQNSIDQSYSAFGQWDDFTGGNNAVWNALTDGQKLQFLQDPENNIYVENSVYYQVRYRIRVVEGVGDDWASVSQGGTGNIEYDGFNYVLPKGKLAFTEDLGGWTVNTSPIYAGKGSALLLTDENGLFQASTSIGGAIDTNLAYKGLCFAIPVALVQRRNQGLYIPSYNPNGTKIANDGNFWYNTATAFNSTSDCFDPAKLTDLSGAIGQTSGRSDGKFFNAIYASDVNDLRMSSRRVPLAQIRSHYKQAAIKGDVRGFEGVPWTVVQVNEVARGGNNNFFITLYPQNSVTIVSWAITDAVGNLKTHSGEERQKGWRGFQNSGKECVVFGQGNTCTSLGITVDVGDLLVIGTQQQHSQAKPTWTDIIGSPQNIAATFVNGVEGQWVADGYTDTAKTAWDLNRKFTDGFSATAAETQFTDNSGASWTSTTITVDTVLNICSLNNIVNNGRVALVFYETQAHFTQDDVNSPVYDLGGVTATSSNLVNVGNILTSSLINKICTSVSVNNMSDFIQTPLTNNPVRNGVLGFDNAYPDSLPKHPPISLSFDDYEGPAVKAVDYLTSTDGVAKLCFAYNELDYNNNAQFPQGGFNEGSEGPNTGSNSYVEGEYWLLEFQDASNTTLSRQALRVEANRTLDGNWWLALYQKGGDFYDYSGDYIVFSEWSGNGWGDSKNKFEIADNQTTDTNDNGGIVLIGTASFKTQFFIDSSAGDDEASILPV